MSEKVPLGYQLNTTLGKSKLTLIKLFIDPILVLSILALLVFGLFVLYSASGQSTSMLQKQALYVVFGLVMMFFISRLDQTVYKSF